MKDNHLKISGELQQVLINDFKLISGRILEEARLGYHVYGESLDNPIIILHPALTGSACAAFFPSNEETKPEKSQGDGWWDNCIGTGKILDTSKFTIICVDHFGGNGQSTGADEVWHLKEEISFADGVELTAQALIKLGVTKINAVIGGSIGGGQALHWLNQNTIKLNKIIDVSGSNAKCSRSNEFFALQADFLELKDTPEVTAYRLKKNSADLLGEYFAFDYLFSFISEQLQKLHHSTLPNAEATRRRLHIARQIGFIRFVTPEFYENKYHSYRIAGESHNKALKKLESWLTHQGDKFVERFSYKALALLCRMDYKSVTPDPLKIVEKLKSKQIQLCGYTVLGDTLFSPEMNLKFYQEIKELLPAHLSELIQTHTVQDALNGHDHFLNDKLLENAEVLRFWLDSSTLDGLKLSEKKIDCFERQFSY